MSDDPSGVDVTCSCGASFLGTEEQVKVLMKAHPCPSTLSHMVTLVTVLICAVTGLIIVFNLPWR